MSHVVIAPAIQVVVGSRAHFLETGAVVPEGVPAADLERLEREGFIEQVDDADEVPDSDPYDGVKLDDLKAMVAQRNEGREDADKIVVSEPGNKPEVLAALVADDAKGK